MELQVLQVWIPMPGANSVHQSKMHLQISAMLWQQLPGGYGDPRWRENAREFLTTPPNYRYRCTSEGEFTRSGRRFTLYIVNLLC